MVQTASSMLKEFMNQKLNQSIKFMAIHAQKIYFERFFLYINNKEKRSSGGIMQLFYIFFL